MITQSWAHSVLNGIAKPVMLSLFPTRAQIVNVSCGSCGEQLAMVTESANGPWLTVWSPTATAHGEPAGEVLWAMAAGPIPPDAPVAVQCLDHGVGLVDTGMLQEQVNRYRSEGARQHVAVHVSPGQAAQR